MYRRYSSDNCIHISLVWFETPSNFFITNIANNAMETILALMKSELTDRKLCNNVKFTRCCYQGTYRARSCNARGNLYYNIIFDIQSINLFNHLKIKGTYL